MLPAGVAAAHSATVNGPLNGDLLAASNNELNNILDVFRLVFQRTRKMGVCGVCIL